MSEENFDPALTYTSYLAVDELLKLQRPLSVGPEHDEMLFIIIHQTYELWFKELIHEFQAAQKIKVTVGIGHFKSDFSNDFVLGFVQHFVT